MDRLFFLYYILFSRHTNNINCNYLKGTFLTLNKKVSEYHQNLVDQPGYVNHIPASHSPIYTIAVMTTGGRIEGINARVAVDHIQINLEDRSTHIRISQIIYFEGLLASYRK